MADIGLVLVLELVLISLRALSWVRSSGELERFRFLEAVFRGLSRSSSEEISITSSISAGFDTMGFFIAGLGRRRREVILIVLLLLPAVRVLLP